MMMGELEMNDCWSLIAVVKECARKAQLTSIDGIPPATTTTQKPDSLENDSPKMFLGEFVSDNKSKSNDMLSSTVGVAEISATPNADYKSNILKNELKDTYKSFLVSNNNLNSVICSTNKIPLVDPSELGCNLLVDQQNSQQAQQRNVQKQGSSAVGVGQPYTHKKKKFEERRVVRYTLEDLATNDKWAWRKYGQKPIKGSPYPRNYYRCSSMKGCKARKQVERSPVDPHIYIVTYTSYHFHSCPPLRHANGSRLKFTGSNPISLPEIESPSTGSIPDPSTPDHGSGSGSGSGSGLSGSNVVNNVKEEDPFDDNEDNYSGAHDESFGSGVVDEDKNGYDILIPNAMADSDLFTGMDHLRRDNLNSNTSANYLVRHDMMEVKNGGYPSLNMEVHVTENGSGSGIGIGKKYASAPITSAGALDPANSMGQNIWDNGMIRTRGFFF